MAPEHHLAAILSADVGEVSYAHLDRLEEARAALDHAYRLQPDYNTAQTKLVFAGAPPEFVERYVDGLRKAGLRE